MALLPGIQTLFGFGGAPKPAQPLSPAQQQTVQQQQQVGAQQTPQGGQDPSQQSAGGNPTIPSQTTPQSNGTPSGIPQAGTGDSSPLENFADLWKVDAAQQGAGATPSLVPNFNLDHAGLLAAAQKVNFTGHISPELVTKAMSGDAESFLAVINQAAQQGFASAAAASGELVKQSLGSAENILTQTVLPQQLRQREVARALDQSNPIFQDPTIAPMLDMLKSQLERKYPTASPEQIATTANQYLGQISQKIVTSAGGTITPRGNAGGNQRGFQAPQETDWSVFFATS